MSPKSGPPLPEGSPTATKGVSPIVATIIMVAIAVGLAGVFVNFYNPFQREQQSTIEREGSEEVECAFAGLDYTDDDVEHDLSTSNDYINVSIDNTGSVDLYDFIISAWIDDQSHSYDQREGFKKTKNDPLEAGGRTVLVANVTDDLSGSIEKVRVVSRTCPKTAKKVVEL